ncbi:MAG: DUF3857 domain-containing protein [Pontixanthobacter sp.]
MRAVSGFGGLAAIMWAMPGIAGDTVLYDAAPEWVQTAEIDIGNIADGPSQVLYDWQHRLDGGVVTEYQDRAVRIDNLEAANTEGTLQMDWSPDKGDLTIHALEIWRDAGVIDLVADGVRFETLRREQGLEQRLLDGRLTATLAVPGLQEGDMLRLAYSTSIADQALGDEMQALQYLPPEPYRVGMGRAIVSWPKGSGISYGVEPGVEIAPLVTRDGFEYLNVDLPIAKRPEMPADAPSRYSRAPVLRVGSFDSYEHLSRVMEPHYRKAAQIGTDGGVSSLVAEVSEIMAATDDPLERTAMAVRLVQDQVSYLMNGLDGGNYLPQSAEDTWDKRYGDCKAKSVLLHALLQRMNIASDVVLVATRGGGALPELLPLPANFDHMIVRAQIDGVDYWLDGTGTASRLANLRNTPPFHYALPLTPGGTDLTPIDARFNEQADAAVFIEVDHSAGLDLPTTYEMRMELSGMVGAGFRAVADEADPETRRAMMRQFGQSSGSDGQVTDIAIRYDPELAIGTMVVKGVAPPLFEFDAGRMVLPLDKEAKQAAFSPNRARSAWRDIPVRTAGPYRNHSTSTIILPDNGGAFTLRGDKQLDDSFANTRMIHKASLTDGTLRLEEKKIVALGEVSVPDFARERAAASRLAKTDLAVIANGGIEWRWDLKPAVLAKRTAKARAAYDLSVAQAEEDDFGPLRARAQFNTLVYDFGGAIDDLTAVIDMEADEGLLFDRGYIYEITGRNDLAIADLAAAYDLSQDNETAIYRAEVMARAGDVDAALELLDVLPVSEDDLDYWTSTRAIVLGHAGRIDEGLAIIRDRLAEHPDDAVLLNADCWFRGLHAAALDDAAEQCTRAVERAGDTADALDSRALVHLRRGDRVAALADLDAALELEPGQAQSRYMRGVILSQDGQREGAAQIASALRQMPHLDQFYARYGISP